MKLFNPFKLHIAQRKNGKYVLRVSSLFWWSYRDLDWKREHYWNWARHISNWCEMDTLEEARELLADIESSKENSSRFVE